MSQRLFTPEQDKEILARYIAGESRNQLARAYGVGSSTMGNTLHRIGAPMRTELCEQRVSDENRHLIVKACKEGEVIADVARRFKCGTTTVKKILKEFDTSLKVGRPSSCVVNHAAFDEMTPETDAWTGFLFADGCISREAGTPRLILGISQKDIKHIMKFRDFLGSTYAITRGKPGRGSFGGPCVYHAVRSSRICEVLTERGIVKKRTRVPIPELASSISFWRGCVDGDGWVGYSNGGPYIGLSGQMPILETFSDFLSRNFGIHPKIAPTESGIWRIQIGAFGDWNLDGAKAVITALYKDATVALDRKNARAQAIIAGNTDKSMPYEEGPSCIEIDDAAAREVADE